MVSIKSSTDFIHIKNWRFKKTSIQAYGIEYLGKEDTPKDKQRYALKFFIEGEETRWFFPDVEGDTYEKVKDLQNRIDKILSPVSSEEEDKEEVKY